MTNKIEISRELADRLTKDYTGRPNWDALEEDRLAATEELRALLAAPYHVVCSNGILCQDRSCAECGGNGATEIAAPAVERQPVAYVLTRDDDVCYEADDGIVISNTPGDETSLYKWKPVCFDTSLPAPVAVVLPSIQDDGVEGRGYNKALIDCAYAIEAAAVPFVNDPRLTK